MFFRAILIKCGTELTSKINALNTRDPSISLKKKWRPFNIKMCSKLKIMHVVGWTREMPQFKIVRLKL